MSITNTTKETLKDEHNKHHQRKLKRSASQTPPKKTVFDMFIF
jgi:hypothetical protein